MSIPPVSPYFSSPEVLARLPSHQNAYFLCYLDGAVKKQDQLHALGLKEGDRRSPITLDNNGQLLHDGYIAIGHQTKYYSIQFISDQPTGANSDTKIRVTNAYQSVRDAHASAGYEKTKVTCAGGWKSKKNVSHEANTHYVTTPGEFRVSQSTIKVSGGKEGVPLFGTSSSIKIYIVVEKEIKETTPTKQHQKPEAMINHSSPKPLDESPRSDGQYKENNRDAEKATETQREKTTQKSNENQTFLFGKEVWDRSICRLGISPQPPAQLEEIQKKPCPIFEGKLIGDTHRCILIPSKLQGHRSGYSLAKLMKYMTRTVNIENQSTDTSTLEKNESGAYWILIGTQPLSEATNKTREEVESLFRENTKYCGFRIPTALELATASSLLKIAGKTEIKDGLYGCKQDAPIAMRIENNSSKIIIDNYEKATTEDIGYLYCLSI